MKLTSTFIATISFKTKLHNSTLIYIQYIQIPICNSIRSTVYIRYAVFLMHFVVYTLTHTCIYIYIYIYIYTVYTHTHTHTHRLAQAINLNSHRFMCDLNKGMSSENQRPRLLLSIPSKAIFVGSKTLAAGQTLAQPCKMAIEALEKYFVLN